MALSAQPSFLFATCQVGAEPVLKAEFASRWPAYRFAYSRPGFLTFKAPDGAVVSDELESNCVFARAQGVVLGKAEGRTEEELAQSVWRLAGGRRHQALHVWERDAHAPGQRGFEPSRTLLAAQVEAAIRRHAGGSAADLPAEAPAGRLALDCVVVGPREWWVGSHRAVDPLSRHPGGLVPLDLPVDAVSRAWLKMSEALEWSGLPIQPGQLCAEIGCAPGGASQALLARGLNVIGIDPAEIDPLVLEHPRFTHIRKRGSEVRRREFRKVRWLTVDMNVAPGYTLDTVEPIVAHDEVDVRGLLLTLKLIEWGLAEEIPEYLERIRGWGFDDVRARQLPRNRQEFSVAALKSSAHPRPRRRRIPASRRRKL